MFGWLKRKPQESELDILIGKSEKLAAKIEALRFERKHIRARIDEIVAAKQDAQVSGVSLEAGAKNV